jgi:hypothetical protein
MTKSIELNNDTKPNKSKNRGVLGAKNIVEITRKASYKNLKTKYLRPVNMNTPSGSPSLPQAASRTLFPHVPHVPQPPRPPEPEPKMHVP